MTSDAPKTIAVFDFDGTLVKGDSFWFYLYYAAGAWSTFWAVRKSFFLLFWHAHRPETYDKRKFIKQQLIDRLLKGRKVKSLQRAAEKLRVWKQWKEPIRAALLDHYAKGHHIVIASGGLDLYLPELLKDLPHHGLICTTIGTKDGVVTGDMVSGNCVRERKAELVAEYLAKNGPFTDSWGYGNLPHDLPMLNLMKQRVIV